MTSTDTLTESDLAEFGIFEGMTAEDRTELLDRMELHRYAPDDRILREGLSIQNSMGDRQGPLCRDEDHC